VGAVDGCGEVAVAEGEPGVVAEAGEGFEGVEGVAADAEAALLVGQAGQVVEDDIDVRRDVEAEELGVVADVGDDGDGLPADDSQEALEEAGGADAAGESMTDAHRDAIPGQPPQET